MSRTETVYIQVHRNLFLFLSPPGVVRAYVVNHMLDKEISVDMANVFAVHEGH